MHSLFVFGVGVILFIDAGETNLQRYKAGVRTISTEALLELALGLGCLFHGVGP